MPDLCCVGVGVQGEPARLLATVRALAEHTDPAVPVLLLADGVDAATAAVIAGTPELAALARCSWPEPAGMATCFNALAQASDARTLVLLESGAVVGPRWLPPLLAALERPGCGLAGPSTNLAWNEQAAFPNARGDDAAIRRDGALALRRFGTAARSLEPLYSLGDFCYAVRRDVVETIGLAEPAYGLGPCWEMDYNIRAARAGFSGVWVGASYVYRCSPSGRRREVESAALASSRRLYQDRFCGLRLRGQTTAYRPHCEGDACEHFAPADLLPAAIALGSVRPSSQPPPAPAAAPAPARVPAAPSAGHTVARSRLSVSCVMPTRGRPEFALQAVRYFQRQHHADAELVIVEDGSPELADRLPRDPRIRLVSSDGARSIGALRNLACQEASGDVIVQWDDDDWHGPERLSRQLAPIADGSADITALRDALIFDLSAWEFWRWSAQLHRQMFVRDVHGGTLAFRREVWQRLARYPDRSLAEDAAFLQQSVRRGARLQALPADGLFLYVRHGTNSWRLDQRSAAGSSEAAGWRAVAEPDLPAADRDFYAALSPAAPMRPDRPLVSCIMPTAGRRGFIPLALAYFARQDYPARELVVVDDGEEGVADLVEGQPGVRYQRLDRPVVLGTKRNIACELAQGDLVAHWDDDDWYAPSRLSVQVGRMLDSGADLSGARALSFYDGRSGKAWRYEWPGGRRIWAAGSSLCYRKELWARSAFPDVATGEDSRFVWSKAVGGMSDLSDTNSIVAIIHRRNTVPKNVHGAHWRPIPAADLERVLGADLPFYRGAEAVS
jgi:glycosyltransferase involved in cell wall biosynthesis/GT2 family glycosyltransferase